MPNDSDENAPFVKLADEAYHIGPSVAAESYLVGAKLIDIAKRSGADALHPGYGFLSENADFADQVAAAGINFIGPTADSIRAIGDKVSGLPNSRLHAMPTLHVFLTHPSLF